MKLNYIEITIRFVRACGPVTESAIVREIETQCQAKSKAHEWAKSAITHGLSRGWLERYDEESYSIA